MRSLFMMAGIFTLTMPLVCQPQIGAGAANRITMRLWPATPPGAKPSAPAEAEKISPADKPVADRPVEIMSHVSDPSLTLYAPSQQAAATPDDKARPLPAVVVFPGGGYYILAYDLEGSEVCTWLNRIGVACVLVKYRVPETGPYPKSDAALQDAQRSLGLVREHAAEWNLDPKRIGVLGFSAGGHLTAALATHSDQRLYPTIDAADQISCRPDFQVLVYPAYLSETDGSLELNAAIQPTANTPSTFLVQTEDDPIHVENALAYFAGLKRAGVAAEMHLYAAGGHGYGLRLTALPVTGWTVEAEKWLHSINVLP